MTPQQIEIEVVARNMRKQVRAKAGLKLDWGKASEEMKQHYRKLAKEVMNDSIFGED